jgi:hypothetical protein
LRKESTSSGSVSIELLNLEFERVKLDVWNGAQRFSAICHFHKNFKDFADEKTKRLCAWFYKS